MQEIDEDEGDGSEKSVHVHNSLTTDGVSIPVHARLKKTESVAPDGDKKDVHQVTYASPCQPDVKVAPIPMEASSSKASKG